MNRESYREISLLNICYKVYYKIISNKVNMKSEYVILEV
jgi:hypothetical protein